jgi:DNA helicase MCM8
MSSTEHQALLEAMEQQSISVAKAGIVCSLSARTAVLAAANPISGHYNRAKTVAENLKLPPNLLSRFDLIFVLLDRPNEAMDRLLSEHVMALHGGEGRPGASRLAAEVPAAWSQDEGYAKWSQQQPLGLRLRSGAMRADEPVPAQLLRKYIAYARAYVHPVLTDGARSVLKQFYLSLRKERRHGDSVPVTTRQLESLVRLAEARAKMELREEVTEADAHDAVAVVKETVRGHATRPTRTGPCRPDGPAALAAQVFFDTLTDSLGSVGMPANAGAGAGAGVCAPLGGRRSSAVKKSQVLNNFVSQLDSEAAEKQDAIFTTAQLRESFERSRLPLPRNTFEDFIDELNIKNHILKKGPGRWKLQASSFSLCSQTSHSQRGRS